MPAPFGAGRRGLRGSRAAGRLGLAACMAHGRLLSAGGVQHKLGHRRRIIKARAFKGNLTRRHQRIPIQPPAAVVQPHIRSCWLQGAYAMEPAAGAHPHRCRHRNGASGKYHKASKNTPADLHINLTSTALIGLGRQKLSPAPQGAHVPSRRGAHEHCIILNN